MELQYIVCRKVTTVVGSKEIKFMPSPVFSIIMPVYNAKKYLDVTFKSILSQDYKDFELIVINDGSTDGSDEICAQYAKDDSRIKLIHQANQGTCKARNVGLSIAKGMYITFCDHDDEYMPGLLSESLSYIKKDDLDVFCFSVLQENVAGEKTILNVHKKHLDEIVENSDVPYLYANANWAATSFVWNRVYKREVLSGLTFDPIFKHGLEDVLFNMEVLKKKNIKYALSSQVLYKHVIRQTSSGELLKNDLINERMKCIDFLFCKEFDFLCEYTSPSLLGIKECGDLLIFHFFQIYTHLPLSRDMDLPLFRKNPVLKDFPCKLPIKARMLQWSFLHAIWLFKFLCRCKLGV